MVAEVRSGQAGEIGEVFAVGDRCRPRAWRRCKPELNGGAAGVGELDGGILAGVEALLHDLGQPGGVGLLGCGDCAGVRRS